MSSTKIGARVRSASAIASLGRASIATVSPLQREVDERVERVLLQVADDDLLHRRLEVLDDVAQQVVRHRPRRRDVLDLQRDRVGLEDARPRSAARVCPSLSRRMTIGMLVIGSTISPLIVISICMASYNARRLDAALSNSSTALAPHAVRPGALDAHRQPSGRSTPAGPGRLTTTFCARPARQLGVAPPARRVDEHVDRPARPAPRSASVWIVALQRLQRHDPPRLLLLAAHRRAAASRPACSAAAST